MHVSWFRLRERVSVGDGGNRDLSRLIRAHANAVEHAIVMVPLVMIYEVRGGNIDVLAAIAGLFLLARIVHAWALTERATSRRRLASAGLTYALELTLAALVLASVFR